jgi:hypothetical protein
VTPPPLQRTSGKKLTPLPRRISYPLRVVGPLAASTISLHWNLAALLTFIDCSKAAGIKISLNIEVNTMGDRWPIHSRIQFLSC